MSDILIKNMEMPKNCQRCPLYLQSMDSERNVYEGCAITQKQYNWGLPHRPSDCPLVEVPPHGRLVDADWYGDPLRWQGDEYSGIEIVEMIKDWDTVIEAEEGT